MEATNTTTALAGSMRQNSKLPQLVRAACSAVAGVLADGIRGEDFSRSFSTSPGADFAALPTHQQNRLLDRGYRP
jgi:hypothetical protein